MFLSTSVPLANLLNYTYSDLWKAYGLSIGWAMLGIFLLIAGYKIFDLALRKIDFCEVLKTNPIALAIVVGSFLIGLSQIIVAAIS